jgi:hypothetical protein
MSDDSDSPDYSDFAVPATSVSAPVVASGGDYSDFAAPSAAAGDPAVYTLLGEAGTDPKGQLAVASTIFNRMNRSGAKAPSAIVTDPANGYEAWQNPGARARVQSQFPPGSPEYQAAAATLGEVTSGKVKPLPYDSFYSPTAQAALGRSPPAFDDGSGVNVGGNVFFTGKYQAPTQSVAPASAGMTETQAEAAYDAAHSQGAASAPITRIEWDPKTETYRDNNGTPYQRTGQTTVTGPNGSQFEVTNAPAEAGKVPIRPLDSGTGTSATPNITAMVADEDRKAAAAGLGQGLGTFNNDVSGLNAFLVNHVPTTYSPQDKAYFNQQVASEHANRFLTDTQFAGDPYYGAAKTAGQIGVTAPLLMAGGAGLGAASDAALSGTAFAPVADFIGGAGSGNLLTRGASLASRGALEGAAAGAIASGGNDQPFMQNVGTGAIAGGVLGPTVPAIGSTVSHMFGGGLLPAVADLADTAVNKYGIPLRVGQIKGAGGNRAAAVQDSNDISRFGTGFAGNNAQQWENFAKGVTRTYGDDSGVMTPANMQAARSTIGSKIGSIAARNTIGDADQVMNDIGGVIHNASQYTTDQQIAPMLKLAQNIGSVVDAPSVTGAPSTLSGQAYSKLIAKGSPLDRAMNSSDSAIRSMAGAFPVQEFNDNCRHRQKGECRGPNLAATFGGSRQ